MQVTLDPGESKELSFIFVPDRAGVYHVRLNGLSGSFEALEFPADFVFNNLIINPQMVEVGNDVQISCLVSNEGGEAGSTEAILEVAK